MKYLITSFLLLLLVLVDATPVEATFTALCHKTEGGGYMYLVVSNSSVQMHLGHGDFLYKGSSNIPMAAKHLWCSDHVPTPTPSPCLDTLGYARLEGDNCYGKTPTPTATQSATPTATASASPTPTPTSTTYPRTDLSDGRSDGRTDSLGCQRPQDGCGGKGNSAVQNEALPATGSHMVELAGVVGLLGYALRRYAGRM